MSIVTSIAELFQFSEGVSTVLIDVATFSHLAAMAAGLGAVVFADSTILKQINKPTTHQQMAVIHHAHGVITIALVVLWLSGIAILGLKTGFDVSKFSPKLITKLGTVSVLTVTAVAMAKFALPYMAANVGRRMTDAPLRQQCALALCAAMSAAGWGTALMLGASKILKTAGNEVMVLALSMHGLAIGGAMATAIAVFMLTRDAATPALRLARA